MSLRGHPKPLLIQILTEIFDGAGTTSSEESYSIFNCECEGVTAGARTSESRNWY
jgi:hypothetical protein